MDVHNVQRVIIRHFGMLAYINAHRKPTSLRYSSASGHLLSVSASYHMRVHRLSLIDLSREALHLHQAYQPPTQRQNRSITVASISTRRPCPTESPYRIVLWSAAAILGGAEDLRQEHWSGLSYGFHDLRQWACRKASGRYQCYGTAQSRIAKSSEWRVNPNVIGSDGKVSSQGFYDQSSQGPAR